MRCCPNTPYFGETFFTQKFVIHIGISIQKLPLVSEGIFNVFRVVPEFLERQGEEIVLIDDMLLLLGQFDKYIDTWLFDDFWFAALGENKTWLGCEKFFSINSLFGFEHASVPP